MTPAARQAPQWEKIALLSARARCHRRPRNATPALQCYSPAAAPTRLVQVELLHYFHELLVAAQRGIGRKSGKRKQWPSWAGKGSGVRSGRAAAATAAQPSLGRSRLGRWGSQQAATQQQRGPAGCAGHVQASPHGVLQPLEQLEKLSGGDGAVAPFVHRPVKAGVSAAWLRAGGGERGAAACAGCVRQAGEPTQGDPDAPGRRGSCAGRAQPQRWAPASRAPPHAHTGQHASNRRQARAADERRAACAYRGAGAGRRASKRGI